MRSPIGQKAGSSFAYRSTAERLSALKGGKQSSQAQERSLLVVFETFSGYWRTLMRIFTYIAILSLALLAGGCVPQPNSQPQTKTTGSPSPEASPSPVPTDSAGARPLTLPVLDAFFADNAFAETLKTRLKLSDDEITKLKEMARSETAKLDESAMDSADGNGSHATADAKEKIKSVIGAEKSEQLAALVNELWRGEDASDKTGGNGAAKVNEVPKDTRVIVNAPAYRMDVFDDGRLVKSYKIAIGYPEFPLPTGLRKARTIIFNPTWTPPDEPWVAKMKGVSAGKKVDAGSRLNPLGPIKIPIGGPSLIHGGKPVAKLGKFGSHGCVGLTTPQIREFSKQLAGLAGMSLTDSEIADFAHAKTDTKEVKLKEPVPVELRYETLVVEEGSLHIYRDVYDQGSNTEENLRAVLEAYGIKMDDLTADERTQVLEALAKLSGKSTSASMTPASSPSASPDAKGSRAAAKATKQTRTTQNQNEIVIKIAALKGKGYPAPVA
jgi:lipoprotein-anchoring transpeptidase ErfK/SrfK/ribosomal protein L12E/L44/L45/RPP1/RPP2